MATVEADEGKDSFSRWLCGYFREHNIDEEDYLEYFLQIVEGEEEANRDMLASSYEEILVGFTTVGTLNAEADSLLIVQKYFEHRNKAIKESSPGNIFAKLSEQTVSAIATSKASPEEEERTSSSDSLSREQKQRLIKTYGVESNEDHQCSSDDEKAPSSHRKATSTSSQFLVPNTNAALVVQKQKELREKKKQEHEMKVERDKQSRQKQLQKEQDRKEKEKKRTQKQEKRR